MAATTFNADTHTELFVTTFSNLNIDDIADFAIGQVADSTALNAKIAQLLKIEHIDMNAAVPTPTPYNPAIEKCVLGSAAEIKRVRSMAGCVLAKQHSTLSPLVFELIMYLKYNVRLWGLGDVSKANKSRMKNTDAGQKRNEKEKQRLDEMKTEVYDWNEVIDGGPPSWIKTER